MPEKCGEQFSTISVEIGQRAPAVHIIHLKRHHKYILFVVYYVTYKHTFFLHVQLVVIKTFEKSTLEYLVLSNFHYQMNDIDQKNLCVFQFKQILRTCVSLDTFPFEIF